MFTTRVVTIFIIIGYFNTVMILWAVFEYWTNIGIFTKARFTLTDYAGRAVAIPAVRNGIFSVLHTIRSTGKFASVPYSLCMTRCNNRNTHCC